MIDLKKTISEAEEIVKNRILSAPDHTIFQSIKAQLDYIKGLREGFYPVSTDGFKTADSF
jgi:hypothetical protein